ncbi:hypothetical protein SAMN05428949_4696 [Chitinophaga sp. YR627]|uniref:hypothetical protein n=1 Tax=Chitinophaga sp. YR627 TaxID=1881041 RepID=UPI0008EA7375|nr:hypothetical protein [Chitinophaga sp. YR627]SFO26082.1 hypothetical protein SAMN05428949_4696 [Chitinophaga sp. YR627]
MKKAKIIIVLIALFAVAGGMLAFKARFTLDQVFYPTTIVTVERGGITYFVTGNLCTSSNRWIHTQLGVYSTVWHLLTVPYTTLTLTQVGGPLTITLPFYPCVTIYTRTTLIM